MRDDPLPPADALAAAGRALYGEEWQSALGRLVGVSRETIRRWLVGKADLGPDHGVFDDLDRAFPAAIEEIHRESEQQQRRAREAEGAYRDLRAWLSAARAGRG